MKCRPAIARLLPSLLALLAPLTSESQAADDAAEWASVTLNDVAYIPLEKLRSFYKFAPMAAPKGAHLGRCAIGNADITLEFSPGERAMRLGGYLCQLAHPVRQDEKGEYLLSRMDVVKLIDPLLRPTYISRRHPIKTVVIDPGHGGHDVGATAPGIREADCTLLVAQQLGELLRQRGYEVILTREQNQYLSDQQRIDRANAAPDALFLSLHLNSGRSDAHGVETYAMYPSDGKAPALPGNVNDTLNAALAFALHASLVSRTGAQDGGLRRARYSLLSSVSHPAALVELGYITHSDESARLGTDAYQLQLAQALADGIDAFARIADPAATLPDKRSSPSTDAPPRPYQADPPPTDKSHASSAGSSTRQKAAARTPSARSSSSERTRRKTAPPTRRTDPRPTRQKQNTRRSRS